MKIDKLLIESTWINILTLFSIFNGWTIERPGRERVYLFKVLVCNEGVIRTIFNSCIFIVTKDSYYMVCSILPSLEETDLNPYLAISYTSQTPNSNDLISELKARGARSNLYIEKEK